MTRARIHAVTIVLASLLLLPLAARPPGAAAQAHEVGHWLGLYHEFPATGDDATRGEVILNLNFKVDIQGAFGDGTLTVRQASGTLTLHLPNVDGRRVFRLEGVPVVVGRLPNPPDGGRGEAAIIIERIELTFAPVSDKPEPIPNATVVLVMGPADPPTSSNGWWVTKPQVTLVVGDSTAAGDGTFRYRRIDRTDP